MSGFIANGAVTTDPFPITNDGFWPDIDGADVRANLRIDSSVSDPRLETAVVNALIQVNTELAAIKSGHLAAGFAALDAVPADKIQGTSVLVHLYRRSIYCTAGAEIAERYRSYDSSAEGNKNADELTPSVDEYRRDARFAIRDLLGTGHATVELI
jgi:hypothetical protein